MIPIGVRKNLVDWTRSRLTHSSNLKNYLFSINYLAHVIRWLISSCWGPHHISLLTSLKDFWFALSRLNWFRNCFEKDPPYSDVRSIFCFLRSIVQIIHYPAGYWRKLVENVVFFEKTVKLAMKWKQGTRSRGQAAGCVWRPKTMKSKILSSYWEVGWATNNLLHELDHGNFSRLVFTFF